MDDLEIPIRKEYIFNVDSTFDGAYADFSKILQKNPDMPTAVLAINDIIALGSLRALQEKGFRIPDQISITGFDNLPMAEMVVPQLTSIDVSKKEIGQTALEMLLLKSSRNYAHPPIKTLIGGRLIKRNSVKKI